MSNRDYTERQHERDRQYAEAWKKLSAKERKELQKAGITGPQMPNYKTGKGNCEAVLQNHAAEPTDLELDIPPPDNDAEREILRRLVAELMSQNDADLALKCFALVSELSYDGQAESQIARLHGVSRSAVSKRCVDISNALALEPSRAMRKLTTRQTYADDATQHHNRNTH